MKEFNACFADLEDPRDDNARHDLLGDFDDRPVHDGVWRRGLHRHGAVRAGEGAISATVSTPAPWHSEPRHVQPAVPPGRPGGVSRVLSGFYAALRRDDPGGGGDRRQDVAPFLRPRRRHLGVAPDQRLGGGPAAGPRPTWPSTASRTRSPPCPSFWRCCRSRAPSSPPTR